EETGERPQTFGGGEGGFASPPASTLEGKGPIAKFVPVDVQRKIAAKCGLKAGDAVFFACDQETKAARLAGLARTRIGEELKLIEEGRFDFCWIVDFPMFEWNEDEKRVDFSHNPFS